MRIVLLLFVLATTAAQARPMHVYLTWQSQDTSRTMTVVFQTEGRVGQPMVRYGTEAGVYSLRKLATSASFPDGRRIHYAQLEGLEPGGTYYAVAGDAEGGFSKEVKFRTIPAEGPLRFVTGGDMWIEPNTVRLLQQAAANRPHFAAIGGDIAYADGKLSNIAFWDEWLDNWEREMITPEGYTVPMVLAVGNHDVAGREPAGRKGAPFYFGFFRQDDNSYFLRRFGPDIVMYVLDTSHVSAHEGPQLAWMARAMEATAGVKHRFALYHVPCYPSHRGYNESLSVLGRQHWVPLFDRYKLTAAFENHDHALKRTKRLRNHKVDQQGTLYLGDGCWGRPPRRVHPDRWYLEKAESKPHVWLVDVSADGVLYRAVDPGGQLLDRFP